MCCVDAPRVYICFSGSWSYLLELRVKLESSYALAMCIVFVVSSFIVYTSGSYVRTNLVFFNKLIFGFNLAIGVFLISGRLLAARLAWEILGIFSYLLVLVYLRHSNARQAFLVFFVNRVSDLIMIIVLVLSFYGCHSFSFQGGMPVVLMCLKVIGFR